MAAFYRISQSVWLFRQTERVLANMDVRQFRQSRPMHRPKFHLARLNSTRHDSTRSTLSSESSRAVPTWRTTNKL